MENGETGGARFSPPPEPINIKFGTVDYVDGIAPHAKIQSNRPSMQRLGKWVKLRRVHADVLF